MENHADIPKHLSTTESVVLMYKSKRLMGEIAQELGIGMDAVCRIRCDWAESRKSHRLYVCACEVSEMASGFRITVDGEKMVIGRKGSGITVRVHIPDIEEAEIQDGSLPRRIVGELDESARLVDELSQAIQETETFDGQDTFDGVNNPTEEEQIAELLVLGNSMASIVRELDVPISKVRKIRDGMKDD